MTTALNSIFMATRMKWFDLFENIEFFRLQDGDSLRQSSEDISAVIVALSAEGIELPKTNKLSLPWMDSDLRSKLPSEAKKSRSTFVQAIVVLWFNLGVLFDIDASGNFLPPHRKVESTAMKNEPKVLRVTTNDFVCCPLRVKARGLCSLFDALGKFNFQHLILYWKCGDKPRT